MKSVSFATLGCKVNQYETEAMTQLFKEAGYTIKTFEDKCDIYIINTCTVTGMGERKSRQMIHRAVKTNPKAFVAVVGCYSQVSPEEVAAIEGVSLVVGTADRSRIVELCAEAMSSQKSSIEVRDIMKVRSYEDMWVSSYTSRTRAFVKIEDGCNEFCTYCIIPYARGPVRSRSLSGIRDEVTALAGNGFSEIVLTGIHLASYGKDLKGPGLADVIKTVAEVDGVQRVRLGSVEPRLLTPGFVEEISRIDKVCNHFHIALQSGCNETLARMNRKYTAEEFRRGVELVREHFCNPAIATDIMVGFPGETREEFESSYEFARDIAFADAHVFAYSNRKGTKADRFPGQVSKAVKDQRSHRLIELFEAGRQDYMRSWLSREVPVLFEQEVSPGVYEGHMTNYVKVHVQSRQDLAGVIADVITEDVQGDHITARLSRK